MRAREHGITFGSREPGALNAITDVPGVTVGHANHEPDHVGVTVVVPGRADVWREPMFAATAVLNGAAEIAGLAQINEWGISESPVFLTATPYVGAVYEAATRVLTDRQPRIGRDDVLIPVVAECDPSSTCDVVAGPAPDVALVARALDVATGGAVAEGQVGAGVGMQAFDFAGGIGTSSRRIGDYTVGVLLLVNFGDWQELRVGGALVGREPPTRGSEGSCVCVVATDAPLLPGQLERLARRPFLGLARTGSYASNNSGEVAIAFSTANAAALDRDRPDAVVTVEMLRNRHLSELFAGCVDASEEAVMNALHQARTIAGARGTLHAFV
jgi:D-aminopeptidase